MLFLILISVIIYSHGGFLMAPEIGTCNVGDPDSIPGVGKDLLEERKQPTPAVFL